MTFARDRALRMLRMGLGFLLLGNYYISRVRRRWRHATQKAARDWPLATKKKIRKNRPHSLPKSHDLTATLPDTTYSMLDTLALYTNVILAYALTCLSALRVLMLLWPPQHTVPHALAHLTSAAELYYLHHLRSCAIPNTGGGGNVLSHTLQMPTTHCVATGGLLPSSAAMKQFACIHHALSNGGLATSPNTKPRSSGPTSANTECWPSAKGRIQARERAREVTPTARARAKEVLQAPTAREVEKQVLEVTSTPCFHPPKDPRCLHNRPWDTLEAPELDILLNNIHLLSIILLRLAMARIMLGMVASSIRARIPAIMRAEEATTAAGRTNSSVAASGSTESTTQGTTSTLVACCFIAIAGVCTR